MTSDEEHLAAPTAMKPRYRLHRRRQGAVYLAPHMSGDAAVRVTQEVFIALLSGVDSDPRAARWFLYMAARNLLLRRLSAQKIRGVGG
jgi:DNA-directed RNA polymerase specialized sigma24 family protein